MVRSTSTIKAAQEQGEIVPHAAINWEKHRVPCWDHISGAWWQGLEGMSSRWILGQSRDLGLFSTCGSPHGYFIYIQPLKQQKKQPLAETEVCKGALTPRLFQGEEH